MSLDFTAINPAAARAGSSSHSADLPDRAQYVVVGGGVIGTSIAYHLAELGWTDVVLVDRAELTSGSTFHSAGLVGQLRGSVTLTRMMMYSAQLYRDLAAVAAHEGRPLPPEYHRLFRLWFAFGFPAFAAVLAIFWLMIAKPPLG